MIKLLIADDSALMRKLLEGIFLDEGDFDIRLARNGIEAMDLVRSFDPQVVTAFQDSEPQLRSVYEALNTSYALNAN